MTSIRQACPRCMGRVLQLYEEPKCQSCGYQDYSAAALRNGRSITAELLASATAYVLRYAGDWPAMRDRTTLIKVTKPPGRSWRIAYRVTCPFCPTPTPMSQRDIGGKTRNRNGNYALAFHCAARHRIVVGLTASGLTGWK